MLTFCPRNIPFHSQNRAIPSVFQLRNTFPTIPTFLDFILSLILALYTFFINVLLRLLFNKICAKRRKFESRSLVFGKFQNTLRPCLIFKTNLAATKLLFLAGSNSVLCMPSKLCFDLHKTQSFTLENSVPFSTFSLSKSAFDSLFFFCFFFDCNRRTQDCGPSTVCLYKTFCNRHSQSFISSKAVILHVKNW